jgi:serine phosphatase RsbU (regulator of sigma subunit)
MGRIRSALRAYALETDDPADVLARLDRKIQRFEPEAIATVLYAVIDPDRSRVTVSSAGHLPPVMIDAAGGRTLDIRPDLPLGVDAEAPRRTTVVELPAGDGLVLYTDGLIERRGQRLLESIDRMVGIVGGGTPDQICNRLLGLLRDQDAADDAAILALVRSDTQ